MPVCTSVAQEVHTGGNVATILINPASRALKRTADGQKKCRGHKKADLATANKQFKNQRGNKELDSNGKYLEWAAK